MLETITALLADASIPSQVKANLFGAVGRLCSATFDIPTAYLEGKADELRASSDARVMLIEESAEQIAEKMAVSSDYLVAANRHFASKILREQMNADKVVSGAVNDLRLSGLKSSENKGEDTTATIDEDWLNTFETEARQKSTEEFQFLFGKVLAGEIRQPGTFSIKTIKILSSIDKNTAEVFKLLCSLAVQTRTGSQIDDARVPSLGSNAGSNSLSDFGLDFRHLNSLNEHGLIISDYNSWMDYSGRAGKISVGSNLRVFLPFVHQSRNWILVPANIGDIKQELKVNGVALTVSGCELLQIVDVEPTGQYTQALIAFFAKSGLVMTETNDAGPQVRATAS